MIRFLEKQNVTKMFKQGGADIESGNKGGVNGGQIYPGQMDDPQMRWAFIRKVYSIVCTQLFFTAIIATAMFFTPAVKHYMRTILGKVTIIVLVIIAFIRKTLFLTLFPYYIFLFTITLIVLSDSNYLSYLLYIFFFKKRNINYEEVRVGWRAWLLYFYL